MQTGCLLIDQSTNLSGKKLDEGSRIQGAGLVIEPLVDDETQRFQGTVATIVV